MDQDELQYRLVDLSAGAFKQVFPFMHLKATHSEKKLHQKPHTALNIKKL